MSRSRLLLLTLLLPGLLAAANKPNIILVMTDDQGYGPVGRHGHPWIKTPNLDKLYAGFRGEGVFFTASGTEANDTAILLATSYRKSNQVLAMRNSYHGRSFTAQAITSHAAWSSTSLSGLLA